MSTAWGGPPASAAPGPSQGLLGPSWPPADVRALREHDVRLATDQKTSTQLPGNTMPTLISQADFARKNSVSRKTVTNWKSRGYLKMVGNRVDMEASELIMRQYYAPGRHRRYPHGNRGADTAELSETSPDKSSAPDAGRVEDVAAAIDCGAHLMAEMALRHMPLPTAKAFVAEWTQRQRLEWTGAPNGPPGMAADYWPAPPATCVGWWSHKLFKTRAVSELDWAEAVETAAEWRRARGLVDP